MITRLSGKNEKQLKEEIRKVGDLALIATDIKPQIHTQSNIEYTGHLTIKDVMQTFNEITQIKGKSSQEEKIKALSKLLYDSTRDEIKYIIWSIQKSFKIGASFKTIVSSLARALRRVSRLNEKDIEKAILISLNQISDEDIVF